MLAHNSMSTNSQWLQLGGWHHFEELRLHTGWLYLCQTVIPSSTSTVKQYGFCGRFLGLASWRCNNLRLRAVATIQTETLWHQTASSLIRHIAESPVFKQMTCTLSKGLASMPQRQKRFFRQTWQL